MLQEHEETEHKPPYIERRKDIHSQSLLRLIDALTKAVDELRREQESVGDLIREAVKEAMAEGFPDGDADGHRRHHEAVILAAENRAKFWQSMRVEVGKWGLIGFIGWALYAMWGAFLRGPR